GCCGPRERFGELRARPRGIPLPEPPPGGIERRAQPLLECGILGGPRQHDEGQVVVVEPEDGVVARRELGAVEGAPAHLVEDEAVVGDIGVELDPRARRERVADRPVAAAGVRQVALLEHRRDRVDDAAVGVEDEALAPDAEQHDRAIRIRGHLTREPQPGALEHPAERGARTDGRERCAVELAERDRLGRAHDLRLESGDGRVDAAADPREPPELARLLRPEAEEEREEARHRVESRRVSRCRFRDPYRPWRLAPHPARQSAGRGAPRAARRVSKPAPRGRAPGYRSRVSTGRRGGTGRVTISDIAERAGVSIGAVSFALNGRKGVSAETRARILRVADELGWAPSTAARSLAEAKTETFGLVLARDPHNLGVESFYMEFFAGLEVELSKRGYSLLLQVVGTPDDALDTLRKWHRTRRVDGVVLTDLTTGDPRAAFARDAGLPAVVVGDPS